MSKVQEHINIMQAYLDGKTVKWRCPKTAWLYIEDNHSWDFGRNEYKVFIPREFILGFEHSEVVTVTPYSTEVILNSNMLHVREVL